jgi:hypothetical protein
MEVEDTLSLRGTFEKGALLCEELGRRREKNASPYRGVRQPE